MEVIPPVVGFVGSDFLAAALATGLIDDPAGSLLIDFGTNSEIGLWDGTVLWVTAAAGGPAFEGSGISCGLSAQPGAIFKVERSDSARTSELQRTLEAEQKAEEAVSKSAEEIQDLYDHAPCGYQPPQPCAVLANEERPRKILLVDDHPDTLRTMSKLLCKWGYAVVTADCVRATLEAAAKESFDVILNDLGLPDGNGMDIMREVRASLKKNFRMEKGKR